MSSMLAAAPAYMMDELLLVLHAPAYMCCCVLHAYSAQSIVGVLHGYTVRMVHSLHDA